MILLDQVAEVMADHRGALHVSQIADMLIDRYPNISDRPNKLQAKLSAALSKDVKKTSKQARFAKVKNKTGGLKRGVYRLKKPPVVTPKPSEAPKVSSLYTGKAGEHAVLSELLFYGFNASSMAVDDGIDIVANKSNSYFHIQVKTANSSDQGAFVYSIKKSSFVSKESYQTFYVFVMRGRDQLRYHNDYLILPSSQIRQYIEVGVIKEAAKYSLRLQKDIRGRYQLNAKQDVTISLNTFNQLA